MMVKMCKCCNPLTAYFSPSLHGAHRKNAADVVEARIGEMLGDHQGYQRKYHAQHLNNAGIKIVEETASYKLAYTSNTGHQFLHNAGCMANLLVMRCCSISEQSIAAVEWAKALVKQQHSYLSDCWNSRPAARILPYQHAYRERMHCQNTPDISPEYT